MKILVVAVGKVKERGLREAVDDYLRRCTRYAKVEEIELKDGADDEVQARFDKAIPKDRARVIALEVDGESWTSEGVAKYLARCESGGVQTLVFLIGGSYGLPRAISDAADRKLSLSRMTLPHRLARLFLAEQIYRGFTILRNEPYSH